MLALVHVCVCEGWGGGGRGRGADNLLHDQFTMYVCSLYAYRNIVFASSFLYVYSRGNGFAHLQGGLAPMTLMLCLLFCVYWSCNYSLLVSYLFFTWFLCHAQLFEPVRMMSGRVGTGRASQQYGAVMGTSTVRIIRMRQIVVSHVSKTIYLMLFSLNCCDSAASFKVLKVEYAYLTCILVFLLTKGSSVLV